MRIELPKGLLGGTLGGLGATSLVAIARWAALKWASPPRLPGAELAAGDSKPATFAEAAVFLVAVPLAALFFGRVLPDFLEARSRAGRLSFEWIPLGLALWLPLWRRGMPPHAAVAAAGTLSVLMAGVILAFRNSPRFRRVLVRSNRRHLLRLAFAAVAWDLARRADPAHGVIFIADLLSEIVTCAAVFIAAAVFIVWRFSRRRSVAPPLRRLSAWAPVSIVSSALALLFWRQATLLLTFGLAVFLLAFVPRAPLGRHTFKAAAVIFLLCCGATIYYQPFAPVNLFEDGHALTYAQAYLTGAVPYRDTMPIHGWGHDGGLDALIFRFTGPDLWAWRLRTGSMAALALVLAAAACRTAFGSSGWSTVAFWLSLSLCPFLSERHLLVFGSLACLAWGVRSGRRSALVLGGVLAGAELCVSLDFGLMLAVGGFGGLVLQPLLESGWRRGREGLGHASRFIGGFLAGALPFLGWLASLGALRNFVTVSFREIPSVISDTWGLPAGSLTHAMHVTNTLDGIVRLLGGEPVASGFLLLLLATAAAVFISRAFRGLFDRTDGVAWLFFAVACTGLRGVLGRADAGHLALYGVLAAVPVAWLLMRSLEVRSRWAAVPLSLGVVLLTRLHPIQTADQELGAVSSGSWTRATQAADAVRLSPSSKAGIPQVQAQEVAVLKAYLETHLTPRETFFDFSNEPALHFLTHRRLPIPFLGVPFYEPASRQREVIALLEATKPPLAIVKGGTWMDAPDGVSSRERAPLVAAYLDSRYPTRVPVSRWTIALRQ